MQSAGTAVISASNTGVALPDLDCVRRCGLQGSRSVLQIIDLAVLSASEVFCVCVRNDGAE
jgi:hypothetical protein